MLLLKSKCRWSCHKGNCYALFHLALHNPWSFHSELKTGIHKTMHTRMVFMQQSPAQEIMGELEHSRPRASHAVTNPNYQSVL